MITVAIGKTHHVLEELRKLPCIEKADKVTGPCDIILKVKANDLHDFKETLTITLGRIEDIMEYVIAVTMDQ